MIICNFAKIRYMIICFDNGGKGIYIYEIK